MVAYSGLRTGRSPTDKRVVKGKNIYLKNFFLI